MSSLLRIGAVAEIFGVSRDTIYDWVRRGYLTPTRTPTNQLMFDETQVERLRNGEHQPRRIAPQQTLEEEVAIDDRQKADSQRAKSWKELPPWEAEVAEARAALTVDELASLREKQSEERERARADAAASLEFQKAEARRRARLKQYAFQVLFIPWEYRQEVAEAVDSFTTSTKVPAWLQPWEQQQVVVSHARGIIQKRDAEKRRCEASDREQQADADRKRVEANRRAAEKLGQEIAKIFDRTKKKDPVQERPSTVAEALRLRRKSGRV